MAKELPPVGVKGLVPCAALAGIMVPPVDGALPFAGWDSMWEGGTDSFDCPS